MALPAWLLAIIPGVSSLLATAFTFLTGVIATFIAWLATYIGIKVAIRVGIGLIFFAILASVLSGIETLLSGISYVLPDQWAVAESWIVPSNFAFCLSTIISTKVAVWFWSWKKYYIELLAHGV